MGLGLLDLGGAPDHDWGPAYTQEELGAYAFNQFEARSQIGVIEGLRI
jgi:hypothetical protein